MTLLNMGVMGLDEAVEARAVEGGNEYKLRILSVRKSSYVSKPESKNPGEEVEYLQPTLEVVDDPTAKEFTHFLNIPSSKMDAKALNRARLALLQFCQAFNLDISGEVNPEDDWTGAEGYAILGMKEDEKYGEQNYIKKLITPK